MKAHCLFEQSGTFKNEFIKLGIEALDYDIQNEFKQTDFVMDLFAEIEGGYEGKPSIFDNISEDDLIIAFFPCTRFEAKVPLWFRGECYQQKNWTQLQKLECSMKYQQELTDLYMLLCKLVIICIKKSLKLIIENPYTPPHYLTTYWCIKPKVIDKDRTLNGDYFKKPTQYWFINCEPKNNLVFEALDYVEKRIISLEHKRGDKDRKTNRSLIHPQYANRFIRQYILEEG